MYNLTNSGRLGNWHLPVIAVTWRQPCWRRKMLNFIGSGCSTERADYRIQNEVCCDVTWAHPETMWPNKLGHFKRFGGTFKTQPVSNFSVPKRIWSYVNNCFGWGMVGKKGKKKNNFSDVLCACLRVRASLMSFDLSFNQFDSFHYLNGISFSLRLLCCLKQGFIAILC